MKKTIVILSVMLTVLTACHTEKDPFFETYTTPYGVPPFDKVKIEHYMPAFVEGMAQQKAEIDAIVNNPEEPTFANTIEALEYSGELLGKVSAVFFNVYPADGNEEMAKIAVEVSPLMSEQSDYIMLNDKLFQRVKSVYERQAEFGLNAEQAKLLEETYKDFVRGGANLTPEQKERLSAINKELSIAELQFGKNVLDETNAYKKWVENEFELAGLPESVKQAAAESAAAEGQAGKWLFITQRASFLPVLQYSDNRELRKELLMAYTTRVQS